MRIDSDKIVFEGYGGASDRQKNLQTLAELEISRQDRVGYIFQLTAEDYYGGPYNDTNNPAPGKGQLWEFGTFVKNRKGKKKEVYIKVQLGAYNETPICISFHRPDNRQPLVYPLRGTSHS